MSNSLVAIIGAGASGLIAAITAAVNGSSVVLIDGNDKVGKKILATGNGRCNFTNSKLDSDLFEGENPSFVLKALDLFNESDTISFFNDLGIICRDKNGYCYPRSLQAESIRGALENKIYSINKSKDANIGSIELLLNSKVNDINVINNCYFIKFTNPDGASKEIKSDKLIIASGGFANPSSGSDGSMFDILRNMDVKYRTPLPALTPLVSKDKFLKGLSGVRSEVSIDFSVENKKVFSRSGEIQFTDFGVSGIVVFDGSGRIVRGLSNGNFCHINIDFMPEYSYDECIALFNNRKNKNIDVLEGVFNNKLVKALYSASNYFNTRDISALVNCIKNTKITISDYKGFDRAQVTSGGVFTEYLNNETMEYSLIPGLYFCGEVIDIDGPCGGYNLQWAWTSGYIAGKSVANDKNYTD